MKAPFYSSLTLILFFVYSCTSSKQALLLPPIGTGLTFIDEYIIPSTASVDGLEIGGLSGLSFDHNQYYLVSDDPRTPRFFTADIQISPKGIDTILFQKATRLIDNHEVLDKKSHLDLEDIYLWDGDTLIFVSEGAIKKAVDPTLFIAQTSGKILAKFPLPHYFSSNPKNQNRPRHNGVFESLTPSYDHKGIWVATELPLILDGSEPTFDQKGTPVRITYFDYSSKNATRQFAYPLDPLDKDPKNGFGVNGVTALVQIDQNTFWILERGYVEGYGKEGNTVKVYEATLQNTTNTLAIPSLMGQKITLASKKLLFDFETIRHLLTANGIDNIEGMSFGPKLPDGSQTILFISDNNFEPSAIQISQVLLFSLKK